MNPQDRSLHTFFAEALHNLCPETKWALYGDTYEDIEWQSGEQPSKEVVEAEALRLQTLWTNTEYQRLRRPEYPPMSDYLDAVYWQSKGDDSKMTAYLAAVEAVKSKYPKGVV